MASDDQLIDDLAQAVLDGDAIDWAATELDGDSTQHLIRQLKIVAAVAETHRQAAVSHQDDPVKAVAAPIDSWGHLRIRECIGRGAFGEVYHAWDTRLDRDVALKLLPTSATLPETSFIHEGRLLARVRHPNVVTIHGADQIGDRIGLWMELVPGHSLEELLGVGTVFESAEVTRIGIELCRALSAVHAAGLLHRDIKAQNVMRADDGRIVLMDFGTGRDLADAGSDLTGTPLYLAPELFQGQPATPRSDIYSLGVVLYHLLTKSYPVQGETVRELRRAHEQNARRELRRVRTDSSARLARVIERSIDPLPERRFATAKALCAELEATLAPSPWHWLASGKAALLVAWVGVLGNRSAALLVGVLAVAVFTFGVWYQLHGDPSSTVSTAAPSDLPSTSTVSEGEAKSGSAALTPSADVTALLSRSRSALGRGDFKGAYEPLREALAANPDDPNVHMTIQALQASLEKEVERVEKLRQTRQSPEAAAALGEAKRLAQRGQGLDAIGSLLTVHALLQSPAITSSDPAGPESSPARASTERTPTVVSSPMPASATTPSVLTDPAAAAPPSVLAAGAAAAAIVFPPIDDIRVRSLLEQYAGAYERMDAGAMRRLWPSVDERALAGAFSSVKSQTLSFVNCDIAVNGATARASCRGRLRYVGRIGTQEPRSESRTVQFELLRDADVWKIEKAEWQKSSEPADPLTQAIESREIRNVLTRYVHAHQALDPDAVSRLVTATDRGRLARAFALYASVQVELTGIEVLFTSPTSATVRCNMRQQVTFKAGASRGGIQNVEVQFRKEGSDWIMNFGANTPVVFEL